MIGNKTKEVPIYNATIAEIKKYYQFVYLFIIDRRKKGIQKSKYKNAYNEPTWAAAEVLYMALYGYTKKTKFAKGGQYIRWNNAPKKLETRVMSLLGRPGKDFVREQEEALHEIREEAGAPKEAEADLLSYKFRTDDAEVRRRMQQYIDDFDLQSSIDRDMLKNFVKTQMLVEHAQDKALKNEPTNINVKDLTMQQTQYANLLGLSKKDRIDLGAERKKGSIAELASVYESTLREYPELETEFLLEELEMLLDKYDRRNIDGERELSAKHFRIVSGGFTVEEAREMTGRKRKYGKKGSTPNS